MFLPGGTLFFKTKLDFKSLEKAVNILIENNDAIRIRIVDQQNKLMQYIAPYEYYKMDFVDFSGKTDEEVHKIITRWMETPFCLYDSNLFDIKLVRMNNGDEGGFLKFHHIISDAWSVSLFCSQVMKIYKSLINKEQFNLYNVYYVNFIESEREYFSSPKYQKDAEFWKEKFKMKPNLCFIKHGVTHAIHDSAAKRESFLLDEKDTSRVNTFCKNNRISPAALFKAAIFIYLGRINNTSDVTIGIPVLNRRAQEKNTMGMFISTVPMRLIIDENSTFEQLCSFIAKEMFQIGRHQRYPFSNILKAVKELHPDVNQLYDVFVSYQNAKINEQNMGENQYRTKWYFNGHNEVSLSIHIDDRDDVGCLFIHLDYRTSIFNDNEIQLIYNRIMHIIKQGIEDKNIIIKDIEIVSPEEKNKLLYEFNDTKTDYPDDKCIHTVFQEQACIRPCQPAVMCHGKSLTYKELDERSDYVAYLLQKKGVKPEDVTAIMLDRSLEMLIGLLGILKAGCAYLPISPSMPKNRIEFMLKDSNAKLLLVHSQHVLSDQYHFKGEIISLDQLEYKNVQPVIFNNPNSLAYVIYTSGSTGEPKGVMIQHHSVVNRIAWMQKRYPLSEGEVVLQKTPFTFDVSVWELFWPLMSGGTVCMLEPGGEKEPVVIAQAIEQYNVSKVHFVPSMLAAFLDYLKNSPSVIQRLSSLKQVFSSGEVLLSVHVKQFYELFQYAHTTLHNLYGPTECTVDVLYYDCDKNNIPDVIPIGKPVDNTEAYILDNQLRLVPVGVAGELCIGGCLVGKGYLNKEDLTKEKFIHNPFKPNQIIYKTGDLAKWDDDGNIIYLGRNDFQVKIRGFRIELGEIENKMAEYPGVSSAAVVDMDSGSGKMLRGYYVADKEVSVEQWQDFLFDLLPEYMIPAQFVRLDAMPLLQNGKVDRKRLYNMEYTVSDYVAPVNESEKIIAQAVEHVMNIEKVSVTDNWFELGMDSITIIKLLSFLGNQGMELTAKDIFEAPTVRKLSEKIQRQAKNNGILYPFHHTGTDKAFICIPYGGGSFADYKNLAEEWVKYRDWDVLSVDLNGFSNESNIEDMGEKILKELKEMPYTTYAVMGQCVGGALAIELARILENEGYKVQALFLGAILPPPFIRFWGSFFSPWSLLTDKTITKFLGHISGCRIDFNQSVIAQFRNDTDRFFKYMNRIVKTKVNIKADICCVFGENDPMTFQYKKKYKKWLRYFNREISVTSINNAKHYFIKTHPTELAEIIRSQVKGNRS